MARPEPGRPHKGSARSRGNRAALYKEAWEVCVIPDGEGAGAGRSLPPHLLSHHFLLDFIFPERFPADFPQNGLSRPGLLEFLYLFQTLWSFWVFSPLFRGIKQLLVFLLSSHIPEILEWDEV